MTNTDKIEISNLLNGLKEMNEYSKKTNEKYVDKKVIDFATEAKKDYLCNKEYLMDILRKNLRLFFNLDNFRVSTSGASTEGYAAMRGEKFSYKIENNIYLVCRLTDFTTVKNTGYDIYFNVKDMDIIDIYWHTSDTKDNDYKVCSAWDTVDHAHDAIVKIPFETPKTANEWYSLYCFSTWTRAKNSILVQKFKGLMNEKISSLRSFANANEKTTEKIKSIGVYVKVDL